MLEVAGLRVCASLLAWVLFRQRRMLLLCLPWEYLWSSWPDRAIQWLTACMAYPWVFLFQPSVKLQSIEAIPVFVTPSTKVWVATACANAGLLLSWCVLGCVVDACIPLAQRSGTYLHKVVFAGFCTNVLRVALSSVAAIALLANPFAWEKVHTYLGCLLFGAYEFWWVWVVFKKRASC